MYVESERLKMFEPWMLAAMEEAGIMDTKEGHINRVSNYLKNNATGDVSYSEFRSACNACNVNPDSFDQQDLDRLQYKLNR